MMEAPLDILFIEDNLIERMKMKRTISSLNLKHKVTEAESADVAMVILEDKSKLPDIILLDLNMPKINGIEFLSILKNDADLNHIPTIILTTSDNQQDIKECYKIGVSGYVLKPLKFQDYVGKIAVVLSYWSINQKNNKR